MGFRLASAGKMQPSPSLFDTACLVEYVESSRPKGGNLAETCQRSCDKEKTVAVCHTSWKGQSVASRRDAAISLRAAEWRYFPLDTNQTDIQPATPEHKHRRACACGCK